MRPPNWIFSPLQGLAFWVCHRRSIFPHYPLGESALIAELCNILYTHIPENSKLECEYLYKNLSSKIQYDKNLTERARADLVVSKHNIPEYVFEVKRASANVRNIEKDLLRLAKLKLVEPQIRVFLVLISEASRPANYVSKKGVAVRGINKLTGSTAYWRVRSVKKASHSFKNTNSATYSCLIEVLDKN